MLAKTMELGLRITRDPALAVLDLHVWTVNDTEPTARAKHPRYALPFAGRGRPDRPRRDRADDAAELLVTAPRFGFTEAIAAPRARPPSCSSGPATCAPCTTSGSTPRRS